MAGRLNARAKGASGEREFCEWLRLKGLVAEVPKRNLEQVRSGGIDVVIDDHPFCYEVKRVEKVSGTIYDKWWMKAKKDARRHGTEAVVAHRTNKGSWTFLICVEKLLGVKGGYAIVKAPVFIKYAQRRIVGYDHYGEDR